MTKKHWDDLRYPVVLRQLSDAEGGGWLASIPMLGEAAFTADGDTPDEAISELEDLRRDLYDDVMRSGMIIPVPTDITDEPRLPSGKWMIRTTPELHQELIIAAESNSVSLNQYCVLMLQRGHMMASLDKAINAQVALAASKIQSTERQRYVVTPQIIEVGSQLCDLSSSSRSSNSSLSDENHLKMLRLA